MKKDSYIRFRCTTEFFDKVKKECKDKNISITDFIIFCVNCYFEPDLKLIYDNVQNVLIND